MATQSSSCITLVSERTVRAVLDWPLAIEAIDAAFRAVAEGMSRVYPTLAAQGTEEGQLVNIKFGTRSGEHPLVGHKTGTFWPANEVHGLSNHSATTLLFDPETGQPRALINASFLNRYRTAAANAVAVTHLARKDASALALIGAGAQAEYEARAVVEVRAIKSIRIASRTGERAERLAGRLSDLSIDIHVTDPASAVGDADIVVTVTPANAPVIEDRWVADGTHVSAMGCDRRGKQELEATLLARSSLFADHVDQSLDIGEFQRLAGEAGARERITALGAVILGRRPGRTGSDQITIFDSSGLAAQDLLISDAVLKKALALGLCQAVEI